METDSYRWLENLESERTRLWALSRDRKCRASLRSLSKKIEPEFAELYDARVLAGLRATARGIFYLERAKGVYEVRLEGQLIVSSEELGKDCVIQQIYADDEGGRLAYFFSKGEDEGIMRIVDVASKGVIAELKGVISSVVFLRDGFYFVRDFRKEKAPDGTGPPTSRVMRDGKVVFGAGVPSGQWISVKSSRGKALVTVHQWSKTEVYAGELDSPETWKKVRGGDFVSYPIGYNHGHLYLLSYEGDGFGQVVRDDGEILVGKSGQVIERADMVGDDVIASFSVDCASVVRVFGIDGREKASFEPSPRSHVESIDSDDFRSVLTTTSFGVPFAAYEYSQGAFRQVRKTVVEELPISEGFARSKDGTKIHYFLLGDESANGVMAYGYGGFSIPRAPSYDPMFVQLVRSGAACVIANLRGGNEYGERWHEAGKGANKQNVFDDFAAVIGEFKQRGCRVVALGRSNGGLLVGAVLTQHPGLLDGAVIGYPVLDMMRFHKMSVGRYWVDEYGDPDKPGDRKFLMKYSPYHNIRRTRYPPVLIYTSLHDDRVHPGHAFKFAAKMEKRGSTPWLRVQSKGGHAGSSPRVRIRELADVIAFIQMQLTEPNVPSSSSPQTGAGARASGGRQPLHTFF